MKPYRTHFSGYFSCAADVAKNFEIEEDYLDTRTLLVAAYDCPPYEGTAFVLFEIGGLLFEVNGSHCSCYGLEGQWDEEETTLEALEHRVSKGGLGFAMDEGDIRDIREYLDNLKKEEEATMSKVTVTTRVELTPNDVKQIIANHVEKNYDIKGDVAINCEMKYRDADDNHGTPVIKSVSVTQVK